MAHVYTPGLRVTRNTTLRKRRQLPLSGDVLVAEGDAVRRDQVVARTSLPGEVTMLNLVNRLGVTPDELHGYMLKKQGEEVSEGEIIAETRPWIRWFRTSVESPVTGTVESVSSVTGQTLLRKPPRPVEVRGYVDGVAVEIIPHEGVVVETSGALIQGIFGIGGECWGELKTVVDSPDGRLGQAEIPEDASGKVLVGGSLLTLQGILRAREVGATAVIGGGIRDGDLRELLGYDLGVAITGTETIGISVVLTEGFGEIAMARKTFEILRENEGRTASVSGATQIRAGVLRPEIIIPNAREATRSDTLPRGLEIGTSLRSIRAPYFGKIGKVTALPTELRSVESETRVRVLEVAFEDGTSAVVPRANVELIEE